MLARSIIVSNTLSSLIKSGKLQKSDIYIKNPCFIPGQSHLRLSVCCEVLCSLNAYNALQIGQADIDATDATSTDSARSNYVRARVNQYSLVLYFS